ncbi:MULTISPECIES: cytochrome c [unclassified Mesorhizobium]|uniref:cytochrome c n=1 Tax=unclassified Mesorhizobium TaxID=325217 RepID=UPI0004CEABB7|nr:MULTISPECIES: cytochrome c [unclassified Mesorhizobium]
MRWTVKAALLWLVCALTMAASVGGGPMVAARQASMKEMAAAAKTIAGMFDRRQAYDAAAFKAAADTLRARTGPALIAEFPSGSLGPPSQARLEIDQSRAEFEALANHIGALARALAAKAQSAPAVITDDMRMGTGTAMGGGSLLGKRPSTVEVDPTKVPAEHLLHLILQDCSSCHSKFRRKLQ